MALGGVATANQGVDPDLAPSDVGKRATRLLQSRQTTVEMDASDSMPVGVGSSALVGRAEPVVDRDGDPQGGAQAGRGGLAQAEVAAPGGVAGRCSRPRAGCRRWERAAHERCGALIRVRWVDSLGTPAIQGGLMGLGWFGAPEHKRWLAYETHALLHYARAAKVPLDSGGSVRTARWTPPIRSSCGSPAA